MNPFMNDPNADYRMETIRRHADQRRMAHSAKAGAMHRHSHSLRGVLGNGLIALGERLAEPPSANSIDFDRAA